MATTLKKSISPDSPQCEEQCVAIKNSIVTKFSKIYSIYNILSLGVTVLNTINTHKFCLEHHIWLEIQNSITIFRDYLLVNLNFFFTHCLACIVSPTVSFKKLTK